MDITRRTSIAATAAIAIGGAGAAAVLAAGAHGQAGPTGFTVSQTKTAIGFVDAPPKGGPAKPFTRGDAFTISGTLVSAGKRSGHDDLVCTTTRPGRGGGSLCAGSLTVHGGELTFSGYNTVADRSVTTFAVTGGTGVYAHASGVIESRTAKGGETLTYRP